LSSPQLNSAFAAYKQAPSNAAFAEIYALTAKSRRTNERQLVATGKADANDAGTVFDDVLMRMTRRDIVPDDCEHYLNSALRRARSNYQRGYNRYYQRLDTVRETTDAPTPENPITYKVPECMIDRDSPDVRCIDRERKKKAADLVDDLLRSSTELFGTEMTRIIAARSEYDNDYALAKAHSLARNSITQRLDRLRRGFGATRKADIAEALAV
jgi:hypothetical protein